MPKTLAQWLQWLESLHPSKIDLGLQRIVQVAARLLPDNFFANAKQSLPFKIIVVGGTNGKGSSLAFLQSILIASGYKTGTYTSPHFLSFNERIQVNSSSIGDAQLCAVFEQIEAMRGDISLTYFEYATLAALYYFVQQKCDVIVMEVGLGGRLDAVNILDSDVSLVTTVDLDHQNWLGDNIEAIAYEKAGIFRNKHLALYGDENTPSSLVKHAKEIDCSLLQYGKDYSYNKQSQHWTIYPNRCFDNNSDYSLGPLIFPLLHGEIQFKNACNAIVLLNNLQQQLPKITLQTINKGIEKASIEGRYQCLSKSKNIDVFVDVAHNPQAAKILNTILSEPAYTGQTHAIFAILDDKDIRGVVQQLINSFDAWHIIRLDSARATTQQKIKDIIQSENKNIPVSCYNEFSVALKTVMEQNNSMVSKDLTGVKNRVIIFGSFLTVAQAMAFFKE
ncbi:MAG: folylpolyglutamate synthase/dihydrofolate synthase family protein [Pseudomonadota bacterium]